ncbi:rta1 domain-containing protein [Colletotrichum truncatum]|uniref:Rta1 domain-containing protein n=1 Tax=Colletotrichum truncatum TaxID=5467 RepID=A0ACC3YSK7_COLTU|nr:rta1 domain-containing protein [Colletotrichum truncatum]KAF6789777.1 rta1 domain-containing protein [Colletotrichum truncatum]
MPAPQEDWSVWLYEPSLPLAIVGTIVYTLIFAWITYLTAFKYRSWYFICVPIGAFCEVIGYAMRCYSTQAHQNIGIFATSTSLIVLAPLLIAAGNYLLIGRLIRAVLPPSRHRIYKVPARRLTRIYVTFDIICLCVQSSGSSMASANSWIGPLSDIAMKILLAGLALQVVAFSTYLCILMRYHKLSRALAVADAPAGWFNVLKAVYASSILILIRCIYRMIEFAEGPDGYTMTHEWIFWVLEGLTMAIAIVVFCVWHPSKYLGQTGEEKEGHNLDEHGVRHT